MKKILVMVLVGVVSMSIFTGCGKSEEEKAMDEIGQHLRDEAAEDGVDIDKMFEEEAQKYNAELEAGNQAIANENEFKESLKNNEIMALREKYETYLNATDPAIVKKAAEEFNTAYDEYLEAAIGEYLEDYSAIELLRKEDIRTLKIDETEIQARVNYLDNCYGKNYNNIAFFKDENLNTSILMYNTTDDALVTDVTLAYSDGRKITPNLSVINEQVQGVSFVVRNNSLIIMNFTWAYEFTDDNTANFVGNENGSPAYLEGDYSNSKALWENTIEEYNTTIATWLYDTLCHKQRIS